MGFVVGFQTKLLQWEIILLMLLSLLFKEITLSIKLVYSLMEVFMIEHVNSINKLLEYLKPRKKHKNKETVLQNLFMVSNTSIKNILNNFTNLDI